MNCNDCQKTILENGGRDHDAAIIAHLTACPPCAKVNEQTLFLAKLLALKNHEQPHPHFEIRTAAAIRKRLSEEKPPLFAWNPLALFRPWHAMLAGAACIALTSVAFYIGGPAKKNPASAVAVQPPIEAAQPAVAPAPIIGNDKPLLVVQDAPPSKAIGPAHTQFGAETNLIKPADFKVPAP